MRISRRLLITAFVPLVVAIVAIGGFLISYMSVVELQAQQSAIIGLRTHLNDLNDFARSYLLYHDERSQRQFFFVAKQAEDDALSVESDVRTESELKELVTDVRIASALFTRIVSLDASSAARPSKLSRQAEQRLAAQVFIRTRDANGIAARIVQATSDEIVARERAYSIAVGLITAVAALLLVAALLRIRRTITNSLELLESGTRRVGSGDLDYRISLASNDELGRLGRSFDKMTAELREMTVSRDDLEIEIRERRHAEALLARVLDAEREAASYASALNTINQVIHSTLDIDEIMGRVVSEIATALDADAVVVQVHKDGHWEFAYEHGLPNEMRALTPRDDEMSLSMRVLSSRQPVLLNDPLELSRESPFMQRHGIVSAMAVPLVIRDTVFGVLFTDRFEQREPFTAAQLEFLRNCASTLDLALENARLYQTEHQIADRLQEALLALPSEVPGVVFDSEYHSASDVARVGGDFYDIFAIEDGLVCFTIGDVAGKGLDASVLTSLVKNTLRAHASEGSKSPAEVIELTNRIVYESTPPDMFVTVFFGVLNTRDGRVVYANAGHTSTVRVGDSEASGLPPTGPIMGAFLEARFEQAETWLGSGDVLLLYTDGVIEARSGGELYGEQRLHELLTGFPSRTPDAVLNAVIADVTRFSAGELRDDVAVLAIQRLEGDAES